MNPPQQSGTELRVCEDISKRQQLGIEKYGVSAVDNPLTLRQWLQHAYEECLDQAVYLKRAMEEMDAKRLEPKPPDMPSPKPAQGSTCSDCNCDDTRPQVGLADVWLGFALGMSVFWVLELIAKIFVK